MCNMLKCIKAHEMQKKRYINLKIRHIVYEKSEEEHVDMRRAWTEADPTHCS
jgi:hypothetical protein